MPELPEVETVRRVLNPILGGRTIVDIEVLKSRIIQGDVATFKSTLVGATIKEIKRIGKYLIFVFTNDVVMVSHLRMEGKYIEVLPGEALTRFARVVFTLDDGRRLCYDDSRQFGTMELATTTTYLSLPSLSKLGKEPFFANINDVYERFQKTIRPIKEALLDQTIMTGLGNIYVDEVLFAVKLHPEHPANCVTKKTTKAIIKSAIDVLNHAIDAGGSTIRSYHPGNGITGDFQSTLHAYGREFQPCHVCGTKMKKIFVGGRGTTFCPLCQRNPYVPLTIALTGQIGAGKSTVGRYLSEKGYLVYDADNIVSDLYSDLSITEKLEVLIAHSLHENGQFKQDKLRDALLSDKSLRHKVERFIHPLVKEKIIELIKNTDEKVLFFEIPLVWREKIDELFPYIIGIETDLNSQRKFLAKREKKVILRPDEEYLKNRPKLSYIIINNGTLKKLNQAVDKVLKKIKI